VPTGVAEGAQQGLGICAIATLRLTREKGKFVLQHRVRPCWLAFAGEMRGQIARRTRGKSALAALAGKHQRLLEAPLRPRWIMDFRFRGGKVPFKAHALDLIPRVAPATGEIAGLPEADLGVLPVASAGVGLRQPTQIGGQPQKTISPL